MNASLCLAMAGMALSSEPNADMVVEALTKHYDGIHSIRVEAEIRGVKSGGLLSDNPYKSKAVYVPYGSPSAVCDEYEVWHSSPKYRQFWTAIGGNSTRTYFDGKVYTQLDMHRKSGFARNADGGNSVRPLRSNVTHAIGYCYPETLSTPLSALFSDRSRVTVTPAASEDGAEVWLAEIRSIPDTVNPVGMSDGNRKKAVVRIWLSLEPVVVRRWATYYQGERHTKGLLEALSQRNMKPSTLPVFEWDGHFMKLGFVNCDHVAVEDQLRKQKIQMPSRVLAGNALGTTETTVRRITINPTETPVTFRPAPPAGFNFSADEAHDDVPRPASGLVGEAVRVDVISRHARELLTSDAIKSPDSKYESWILPLCGATLMLTAAVLYALHTRFWRRVP